MIQQISNNTVPQKTQAPQAKKDSAGGVFESMVQKSEKTVTKDRTKQTVTASPEGEKSPDKTDETNPQLIQPNLAQFAQMFQAPVPIAVSDMVQAQGEMQAVNPLLAVTGLPADPKQAALLPSAEAQVGNSTPEKIIAGNGLLPNPVKPEVPTAQLTDSNPTAVKTEAPVQEANFALQEKPAAAADQSGDSLPVQTQPAAVQTELPKQDVPVIPKQDSSPVLAKPDPVSANVPLQAEKQVSAELSPNRNAEDRKETIPMEAASQSQNDARLSSLYENGNVVIKISDAKASGKAIGNQLTDKVLYHYNKGNPQFQMELSPQNLGKVSVKLAIQDGVLNVTIQAANPKTQSLLMENSADIKTILQTSINQPVQIHETAQDHAWYQQNQQNQQNQPQQDRNQRQNIRLPLDDQNGSTDDFLTVMQQLRQQVSAM